jgi:hypothetical protein
LYKVYMVKKEPSCILYFDTLQCIVDKCIETHCGVQTCGCITKSGIGLELYYRMFYTSYTENTLSYCQNPNSTLSSIQLSLRLNYILTHSAFCIATLSPRLNNRGALFNILNRSTVALTSQFYIHFANDICYECTLIHTKSGVIKGFSEYLNDFPLSASFSLLNGI